MARLVASKRGATRKQKDFSKTPRVAIPRSVFNRSCNLKTTFDEGYLVPIFVDEALPGDTFKMRASLFGRMATPIFPVMDNFFLDVFWFAVPYRLVWDNWQKFNGEQENPGDSVDFLTPQITQNVSAGSLSDYMGIPGADLPSDFPVTFNAFHHRAYNLIWNEWFRDQNLQNAVPVNKGDGPDSPTDYKLLRRGKRHDYFTSCLPFTQKGQAVELPLGTTAPLTGNPTIQATGDQVPLFDQGVGAAGTPLIYDSGAANAAWGAAGINATQAKWVDSKLEADNAGVLVDLTQATAATINQIREAFQVQRLLEKDARGGTRYTEIVRSHFGVVSPDARLQRPEYLGGGSTRINAHPIASTIDNANANIGDLGGFVTLSNDGAGFVKSFTEHCVIIGLVNIRADLTYQQGLERMWTRRTRLDYYWPSFAHLGEQAVLSKEIYVDGTAQDDDVFGYQERYAEYRYKPSRTSGLMRSSWNTAIDQWHLGLDFESRPLLNDVFIEDNPPFERVIAVPSEPHFLLDAAFDYRCARPMPTYSVPGLVDHF